MRDNIDSNYHVGEIKMWKNARKDKSVAVVVEGKSDELFFQKFLDDDTIFFPVDGFEKVIDVIEKTEKEVHCVIGIIDADFRRCTHEVLLSKRIFITDYHDVEMMTISSRAWSEVIGYHSQKTKLSLFQKHYSKPLREYLIEMSSSIACVRFLNSQRKLGLVFKTLSKDKFIFLDYGKFISNESFIIDTTKLIETIENKSQKQNFFQNNPNLLKEINEISKNEFNPLDFCNGHDVINILAIALKKEIGKINISGSELESLFIVAYRYEDFMQTELYANLKKWEADNSEFKLFSLDKIK